MQHSRGVEDGVRKKKERMKESLHWPEDGEREGSRTGVARTEVGIKSWWVHSAVADWVEEVLSLRCRCEAISAEGPPSEWWLRKTTSRDKEDILETREELFNG